MAPVKHVVLFLVDGMRPDGLQAADTPFIDELTSRGLYTYRARSVFPTTTLPCHVSLFHSIPPEVHGVRNNTWQPLPAPVPGLTDVVAQSGLTAAAFYNWEELRDISRPGSLAASFYLKDVPDDGGQTDRDIAALAAAWLQAHDWSFAFVYLHNTDKNGHRSGWMSDAYLAAIGNADRCIRGVCRVLPDDTAVIVTSDHGGHENTHHSDLEEDMTIPFVLSGPGVPQGREMSGAFGILDVAPTVASLLGLTAPAEWVGRPLALDGR
jgi:predicted AlkP superfamily pyrophosphatase or phosphodiesterase